MPLLATLVSVAPIYCYFDVQEEVFLQYRSCFQAAGKSGLSMPCELKLGNEEGFPHRGRVNYVDNAVNPKTGTIRLRAVFANEDRALVPGMFATVRVPAGPAVPALLVPEVAVLANQNYKFVYVAKADGTAEERQVKVGRTHGPLRAVVEGLTPEDGCDHQRADDGAPRRQAGCERGRPAHPRVHAALHPGGAGQGPARSLIRGHPAPHPAQSPPP